MIQYLLGRDFSGTNSPDFFVRESSGGRFLGRIAKDLIRMTKWQFSSKGLQSLAKNGVMTLFNQSEKSFQLSSSIFYYFDWKFIWIKNNICFQ